MVEWFFQPTYWTWWLFGVLLVIIEVLSPGVFFLWMGLAALLVGVVLWLLPSLSIELQWLLFAAGSVASVALWKAYLRRHPTHTADPTLNRRGEQLIGRLAIAETALRAGEGRVNLGGSSWKVFGPDCPAGTRLKVVGVEGTVLRVEPAED